MAASSAADAQLLQTSQKSQVTQGGIVCGTTCGIVACAAGSLQGVVWSTGDNACQLMRSSCSEKSITPAGSVGDTHRQGACAAVPGLGVNWSTAGRCSGSPRCKCKEQPLCSHLLCYAAASASVAQPSCSQLPPVAAAAALLQATRPIPHQQCSPGAAAAQQPSFACLQDNFLSCLSCGRCLQLRLAGTGCPAHSRAQWSLLLQLPRRSRHRPGGEPWAAPRLHTLAGRPEKWAGTEQQHYENTTSTNAPDVFSQNISCISTQRQLQQSKRTYVLQVAAAVTLASTDVGRWSQPVAGCCSAAAAAPARLAGTALPLRLPFDDGAAAADCCWQRRACLQEGTQLQLRQLQKFLQAWAKSDTGMPGSALLLTPAALPRACVHPAPKTPGMLCSCSSKACA